LLSSVDLIYLRKINLDTWCNFWYNGSKNRRNL
jgi:hypothetical protein